MYRSLDASGLADWERLAGSRLFAATQADGRLVKTTLVDSEELGDPWVGCLRHERVAFVSYPYEWSFSMLKDAARLQLELLQAALEEDLILKDATPYNVQWRGAAPVFIDVGSFTALESGGAWIGYRQFCMQFLYPLMMQAYRNLPFQPWLRGRIEGLEPADAARLFAFRDLLRPGVATHVKLQAQLQRRTEGTGAVSQADLRAAGYDKRLIARNVANLLRLVTRLQWAQAATEWSDYTSLTHYSAADTQAKADFVDRQLADRSRRLLWDVGANTGTYSRIASRHADYVVAMDADPLAVEKHYRQLAAEGIRNVLPLLVDLTDPSPDQGWRTRERKTLAARGRPDTILALALIHHVVIGRNVPMIDFVAWLADIADEVIIEFVGKDDPMVQRLLANKRDNYDDYGDAPFRAAVAAHFDVAAEQPLADAPRTLLRLRRRG